MKVAVTFPGCNRRGGVERIVFECARFLATRGHAVDVYASSLAYDRLAASAQKQGVSGVGDAAVTVDGFNAFSSSKACGRTLIAKQGERTVVVAACTGATPPSAETLVGVANNVLARVPAN